MTLRLFHTNDFHGRLTAERAAVLCAAREPFPGSLLLDAGDAVSAGNLGFRPGGESILTLMSDLGYQAMTVGNRESHPRKEIFPLKLSEARFPVLCANLTARPGAPLPTRPSLFLTAHDERNPERPIRVGVFGLTVQMFTRKMWSSALCDYFYEDPVETARSLVPALRAEAEVVVALSHLGLQGDEELAAAVPGIDLIIGGHTHAHLTTPRLVGRVPILHTTAYAHYLGCARIALEPGGGVRVAEWSRLPLAPAAATRRSRRRLRPAAPVSGSREP
jgi:2',3'-cyclic-nucleotide 2'-phosphodiesterase (5'-nucleotidase family)